MKKFYLMLMTALLAFMFSQGALAATDDPYTFLEGTTQTLLESNLFTHKEDYEVYNQAALDMTGFDLVLENDDMQVFLNPVGLALRIYNKTSGFYWASDLANLSDYELTGAWIRRIQSALTIDYLNDTNITITSSILKRRSNENAVTSYDIVGDQVIAHIDFIVEMISLDFTISIDGKDITFEILRDSINEYGDNRLTKLYLYEFFGTVYSDDVPGYYFIPSGNGALVRFSASSSINNVYRARFYSQDKYRQILREETALNYPVFGVVEGVNQNALFTRILNGAEYAEYVYTPPTYQTEFHSQNVVFLMRENYIQPLSGTENVTIYDAEIKNYSPKIQYTILDGNDANYIGFANQFKQELLNENILDTAYKPQTLGMHVDVLMQDYEQGLLFKNNYVMTSVDDLLNINNDLTSKGVENIQYTLRGYNNGSYSDRSFDNYTFDSGLGSVSKLKDLNVEFYYDPTITFSYSAKIPSTTLKMINKVQYQIGYSRGDYYAYFTDPDVIFDHFDDAYNKLSTYGGMALDGLSNELNSNENYQRNDLYQKYDDLFTTRLSMYRPDFYNLDNASSFYMSSLYHNRSRFFTDSVPFEQILLSGTMEVYSQFLNFSSNIHIDVLKMIEYGIEPAFLITKEPSHLLTNTMNSDLYATYYGNLDYYMTDTYEKAFSALEHVIGEQIVNREILEVGVVRVDYANGYSVFVNYTDHMYSNSFINVDPMSAQAIEVTHV